VSVPSFFLELVKALGFDLLGSNTRTIMDSSEVRNRLIGTALAAFGAAATTATFLLIFQDVDSVKKLRGEEVGKKGAGDNGPIARGIPKCGEASLLFPDFIQGLKTLVSQIYSTGFA
jgi:hypothetical protein